MTWLRTLAMASAVCLAAVTSAGATSTPKTDSLAAKAALGAVGTPFSWNGASATAGFDSSGLVVWAYSQAGVLGLPHFTGDLWMRGTRVDRRALRPGDIVFFNKAAQVGIYLGHGDFVHAPGTGRGVTIAHLAGVYARSYTGAVRI